MNFSSDKQGLLYVLNKSSKSCQNFDIVSWNLEIFHVRQLWRERQFKLALNEDFYLLLLAFTRVFGPLEFTLTYLLLYILQ